MEEFFTSMFLHIIWYTIAKILEMSKEKRKKNWLTDLKLLNGRRDNKVTKDLRICTY